MKGILLFFVLILFSFPLSACTSITNTQDTILDPNINVDTSSISTVTIYSEELYSNINSKFTKPESVNLALWPEDFSMNEDKYLERGLELANMRESEVFIIYPAYAKEQYNDMNIKLIKEIKKQKPNMLCIAVEFDYNPEIREAADIVLGIDYHDMAEKMLQQAKKMGANAFVYYAHSNSPVSSIYRSIFPTACEKSGLNYIEELDYGVNYSSPVYKVVDNMEEKTNQHGNDICFFTDSCDYMYPFLMQALNLDTIVPQSCHPNIYHGFPVVWESTLPEFDIQKQVSLLYNIADETNLAGRVGCWPIPYDTLALTAAVEYSTDYIVDNSHLVNNDIETWRIYFDRALSILNVSDTNIEMEQSQNCIMFTEDYIVF